MNKHHIHRSSTFETESPSPLNVVLHEVLVEVEVWRHAHASEMKCCGLALKEAEAGELADMPVAVDRHNLQGQEDPEGPRESAPAELVDDAAGVLVHNASAALRSIRTTAYLGDILLQGTAGSTKPREV